MGKVKEIKAKPIAADVHVTTRNVKRDGTGKVKPGSPKALRQQLAAAPRTAKIRAKEKSGGRGARTPGHQRTVRVRELVPQTVCGPRTRVQRVFRVEEREDAASQTHLVFNDRHGWYCEHGADCPAVAEVRRSGNFGKAGRPDWTPNGRMRA